MNILQTLSDCGLNPFAAKLLVESYESHPKRVPVSFPMMGTVVTLRSMAEYTADQTGAFETTKSLSDMNEPELQAYFTTLARKVEAMLPPGQSAKGKCLFALLVFDESNIGQYVSNAERAGLIKTLRETADRLELRQDVSR